MSATEIILLEHVENLGEIGEVVRVKPGYARNYLLPRKKALRASKENIAYFEAQRKQIEAENEKRKKEAQAVAKKIEGLNIPLIRQASEAGHLYGSVAARDIAQTLSEISKQDIQKGMVRMNQNFKSLGLFEVEIAVHPEVRAVITLNIARSPEEAKLQEKSGKALIESEIEAEEAKKVEALVKAEEIFENQDSDDEDQADDDSKEKAQA